MFDKRKTEWDKHKIQYIFEYIQIKVSSSNMFKIRLY